MARKKCKVRKSRSRGTVSLSGCLPLLGVAVLPLFAGMLIYSAAEKSGWVAYAVYGIFTAMSILLILSFNWKIDFDDNGFTYRNIFRISQRYRYSEITHICGKGDLFIFVGRRILTVDNMALNRRSFQRMLHLHARQAYRNRNTKT